MDEIFRTLDDGYIKYKNNTISIIVDKYDILYFNAKETAHALGYKSHIDAIKQHTNKKDRIQMQNIDSDNKKGHPHSLYFNEGGLYKFIVKSNMPASEKFTDWVTHKILPSIRKYGYYKTSKEYEIMLKKINIKLKKLKNAKKYVEEENKILKQNLKKELFPKGGLVYAIDYSTKENEIYKIGMTENMIKRKEVYNSHTLDKKPVAFYLETKCPRSLEWCIRGLLYDYRYQDKRDYYVCSLKKIKLAFKACTSGSKKVNCSDKSDSDMDNHPIQIGGSYYIYDNEIFIDAINKTNEKREKIKYKIKKLNKKMHEP